MNSKEFSKYSQKEIENFADETATTIVIREYINGNSKDFRRETTNDEYFTLYTLSKAAMLAYGHDENANIDSILNTVEFALHGFIPEANTYDSIYIPIRKITKTGNWA